MCNRAGKPGIRRNPGNRMNHLVSFVTFENLVTRMNTRTFSTCSLFGYKETTGIYIIQSPLEKLRSVRLFQAYCISII